jgi:hypothetical protein
MIKIILFYFIMKTGEMEVKNPLFKEDFGFSNTNIQTEIENKEDAAKNTEEKSNVTEK